jgi:PAS domain S-box-containing protein
MHVALRVCRRFLMTIRTRTILMIGTALVFLLLALLLTSARVLMHGFKRVEDREMELSLVRVRNAVQREIKRMAIIAQHSSPPEEIQRIVTDGDLQYADAYFTADWFEGQGVSVVAVLNADGRIVYGSGYDEVRQKRVPLPAGLAENLAMRRVMSSVTNTPPVVSGIILLPEAPMLLAVSPVYDSRIAKPHAGMMAVGRFVDEPLIQSFSRETVHKIILHRMDMPDEWYLRLVGNTLIQKDALYIMPSRYDAQVLSGFTLWDDLDGRAAVMFHINKDRSIFRMGQQSLYELIRWLVLSAVVFSVVILVLLSRHILSRLMRLASEVAQIRSYSDLSARVTVSGKDELTKLSGSVNEMLVSLENAQAVRERMQGALAAEKERLMVTLRSIGDAVIATDTAGRIVLMNPVAEHLTAWPAPEALGKSIANVLHLVDEETRQPYKLEVQNMNATSRDRLATALVLVSRDGVERMIRHSMAFIRDESLVVFGVVLVLRDVTEDRRQEEDRWRSNKLESIGVLAGGIAHDFNNILTSILANVCLAQFHASPDGDLSRVLADAEKACVTARTLTRQLLTFARGGAPIKATISIGDLLREVTGGSNTSCAFDIPPDLWLVAVDQGQMAQAISNVIINAVEAMPAGGALAVKAVNLAYGKLPLMLKAGQYVHITIADQGGGIPKTHLSRIFDPYFTTKAGKSGLGLTTTFSIITRHDGYITAESEYGRGAVFHIYLPAVEGRIIPMETSADRLIQGRGRMLLMDDEETIRMAVGNMLRMLGYEVDVAADGHEAMKRYQEAMKNNQPFDIVLLDLTVPGGMGGVEAFNQLRRLNPQVRAIVSSGYSDDPVLAQYTSYGFSGMVMKPYGIKELSQVIHDVMHPTAPAPDIKDTPA